MKFIQTLYFDKSINPFKYNFGWASPEYHLMGWTFSCLQLKHVYNNVDLYCNSEAASLLSDQLGLPYSKVHITHDNLEIPNEQLWALPKVFTYSLQDEPFLHFDGDVFLFKKLPASLIKSDLIAQNLEEATDYSVIVQAGLIKHFTYLPECVRTEFESTSKMKAVNAGILGGTNTGFIKEYAGLAFDYINNNIECLTKIDVNKFNTFFEQHLFYSLAKQKGLTVEFLIEGIIPDNEYQHLDDFHEVPCNKNYLHLLGHYKRDELTCQRMASKLRQLYPEYYYKIIELCNKKYPSFSNNFYVAKELSTINDYLQFSAHSKEVFLREHSTAQIVATTRIDCEVPQKPHLAILTLLNDIVIGINDPKNFTKTAIETDLLLFSKNLIKALEQNQQFQDNYIYGRDLDSVSWFCELFGDDLDIPNKMIAKCLEVCIIKSEFDWAGLLNQHKRVGVKYYEDIEINTGEYYNLIVPEVYDERCSVQDLDEMENTILEQLTIPLSIQQLLTRMYVYVEDDILENHLAEYEELIIVMLKQLVLKKAVKPLSENNNNKN